MFRAFEVLSKFSSPTRRNHHISDVIRNTTSPVDSSFQRSKIRNTHYILYKGHRLSTPTSLSVMQ